MAKKNQTKRINNTDPEITQLIEFVEKVVKERKSDIYLIGGGLYEPLDSQSASCVRENKRKNDALLLLATYGGDANVAFRIARCFQANYETFSIFVPNKCKSAGTLLAIGATELIMATDAELGPLDVQLSKPDELVGVVSGLAPVQALKFLQEHSFDLFEHFLIETVARSGQTITTKTASEIATEITIGLFQHIYNQLDPIRLGEYHGDMLVAEEYGKRLNDHSHNLKRFTLHKLSQKYPSHGFVIDKKETEKLFQRIRPPKKNEQELANSLLPVFETLLSKRGAGSIVALHTKIAKPEDEKSAEETGGEAE